MWIKAEERNVIINTQLVSEFNVKASERFNTYCILAQCMGIPKPIIVADYELKRTAQSALDIIFEAIKSGKETYIVPEDGDIRLAYSDGIIHGGGLASNRKAHTTGKTK